MREHDAIFANFINRYGDSVLLDYAEDIVLPAFTNNEFVRTYGKASYQFYKARLVNVARKKDPPVPAIIGRFIKDTELTRVQKLDPNQGLIRDERSISSAPSAFFVIFLANHRLIYYAETPYAPDLNAFRVTALDFMRQQWRSMIDTAFEEQDGGRKLTKKALRKIHPIPTLEVIPLADKSNLVDFVKRYNMLKKIDFRLVRPNDELDAAETLDRVRKMGLRLNASTTKVTASNNEGLNLDESISAVTEATETANQEISLSGVDENGNRLDGNNDSFKLSVPVLDPPMRPLSLAKRLYREYQKLVEAAAIKAPPVNDGLAKIARLMERL